MTPKDFFMAGLTMEEAREQRDHARTKLRAAAAEKCPEELAALDAASVGLENAEKAFLDMLTAPLSVQSEESVRAAMVNHVAQCDNPNCLIKKKLEEMEKGTSKSSGGLN